MLRRSLRMRLLAPAKINLHLRVAPLDGSGFHPICSWFCTVALFDTLTIEPADTLSLTCDDPRLPCDATNLVHKAASKMQALKTPAPERSAGPDVSGPYSAPPWERDRTKPPLRMPLAAREEITRSRT